MINFALSPSFNREVKKLEKTIAKAGKKGVPVATQRALNLVAKKASTQVIKQVASALGVAQKHIRRVIKPFNASLKAVKLESKVWIGLKRGVPFELIKSGAAKKRLSRPFRVRFKSGHVGMARRVLPSTHAKDPRADPNLPIDDKLRLNPQATTILKREAAEAGRTYFRTELVRQLKLALQKIRAKRR